MAPVSNDSGRPSGRWPWLPLAVLVGSLLIFAALSIASWVLYDRAEQQLLRERTGEASQVLTVAVGNIQAPIETAATTAGVSEGNPEYFLGAMSDQVGEAPRLFTSAVLYRLADGQPVASLGAPVALSADGPASVGAIANAATSSDGLVVVDLLTRGRRLGYAAVDRADDPQYLVYAERQLNPDPNVRTRTDEPFAQLNYAIYVNDEQPDHLLSSSLPDSDLPIDGRRESALSPFGNQQLLLVMTPIGQLSGWLFANLWWIVGLAGLMFAVAAAGLTRQLVQAP